MLPKRKGRAAITDEKEFGAFLCALNDSTGWPTLKGAIKFQVLTMVCPREARTSKRSEFDLHKATWSILPVRMKMRRPHIVPLSSQAASLLEVIWPYSDNFELVFPSIPVQEKATLRKRIQRSHPANGLFWRRGNGVRLPRDGKHDPQLARLRR